LIFYPPPRSLRNGPAGAAESSDSVDLMSRKKEKKKRKGAFEVKREK
jgi:hypothetical protein